MSKTEALMGIVRGAKCYLQEPPPYLQANGKAEALALTLSALYALFAEE